MGKNKKLHVLSDADKAWEIAKEQTNYDEQGQATIAKDEREDEEDWE